LSSSLLKTYIDLYQLIKTQDQTHEESRRFGLAHSNLLTNPIELLDAWRRSQLHLLPHPSYSKRIEDILFRVTTLSFILSFLFGIFSGMGLLYYNGDAPINLLYFLTLVSFVPIITMVFTLLAILSANKSKNILISISPTYWIEKIVRHFSTKEIEIYYNPLISNWLLLKRSLLLGIIFSFAILIVLLVSVLTKDIAFSWSTTLQITPQEFHTLLLAIALPWQELVPQAVPSLELIQKSQYFRLGNMLNSQLLDNTMLLGEWWKFLAMSTIVYALLLRIALFGFISWGYKRALYHSILLLGKDILHQMQEPLVSTQALTKETPLSPSQEAEVPTTKSLQQSYPYVIGWAIDESTIQLHNQREAIETAIIYQAGGNNSLEEDQEIIDTIHTTALLYVKSWEPPTMDFIDFLMDLSSKSSVILYPLGTIENHYMPTDEEFAIWERKVSLLKNDTIRMKR